MTRNEAQVREVAPVDLPSSAFLLDVREADEWRAGHAPHAMHIPMSEVPERISEIPAEKKIAVLCRSGVRSFRVAEYLLAAGYHDVVNVAGGMRAWHSSGALMVADNGEPARVV